MKRVALALSTATFTIAGALASGTVHADDAADQASAEAAIATFNSRMTDAGFVSDGPPDETNYEPGDESEMLSGCLGNFEATIEPGSPPLEGETARAFSDDFTFTVADATATTDPMSYASDDEDGMGAVVFTLDADHQHTLDTFVELVGSQDTADCLEAEIASDFEPDASTDDTTISVPQRDLDIVATPALGVGDASARFDVAISVDMLGTPIEFGASILVARVDRSLVLVLYSAGAEPASSIDPAAELAALADALG